MMTSAEKEDVKMEPLGHENEQIFKTEDPSRKSSFNLEGGGSTEKRSRNSSIKNRNSDVTNIETSQQLNKRKSI